jgi:quercetin dioxygenase-like cupin family protein
MSRELAGEDHGGLGISLILVDAAPGQRVSLHRHPYDEVFVVHEGEAQAIVGKEERRLSAGDVVLIRAGEPHGFVNVGNGPLRQTNIHLSPRFVTEWLEQDGSGS